MNSYNSYNNLITSLTVQNYSVQLEIVYTPIVRDIWHGIFGVISKFEVAAVFVAIYYCAPSLVGSFHLTWHVISDKILHLDKTSSHSVVAGTLGQVSVGFFVSVLLTTYRRKVPFLTTI